MRKIIYTTFSLVIYQLAVAQCTTTNATGCKCKDITSNDCDLLPNIKVAREPLMVSGSQGVIEYSQTGNGPENGRLRISVSTPNIGHGPLTIMATQTFICGNDTFTSNPGTCPDGSEPRQLIKQRIYHKNGNTMTYWDRPAGSMTYHPTHAHMHVDDWGMYWLRRRDTTEPNPLNWPIIGNGAKLGFCLMDYGSCSTYNGHCRDSAGNVLLNNNFPNFGLGGGNYSCSPVMQGISSGYTDIYYQSLDGMYITIPPGTCNGDYYIVVQIDPHNYFLEENENDNVLAVPYTLTKQVPGGVAQISVQNNITAVCPGQSVTLSANSGNSYLWNTGDTVQSITVSQPGQYTVQVASQCGTATSQPVVITHHNSAITNVTADAICPGDTAHLAATATGTIRWFDAPSGGNIVHTGNQYSFAPATTTTLYVSSFDTINGLHGYVGPVDTTIGSGSYFNNDQHQIFDVHKPIILKTVKVFTNSTKHRIVELRNSSGVVLRSDSFYLTAGTHILQLNYAIQPGTSYQLGWKSGSSPGFYRNSSGANYPYTLGNLLTITGNSANLSGRWYAYYNWEVEEQGVTCISPPAPVTATVNPLPSPVINGLQSTYYVTDTPITLVATPDGGSFSGPGVSNGIFDPMAAGVGGPYTIQYTYTDSNGCTNTAQAQVTVVYEPYVTAEHLEGGYGFQIYPNPARDKVCVRLNFSKPFEGYLRVANALGELMHETPVVHSIGKKLSCINELMLPDGMYLITLTGVDMTYTGRVIISSR
ncbi:MAG: T9SS type A sorting domain-containing protein [Chitinophagales bacterium]|nr:T9SS type A sorting domain-containing protein [Chitinophagales bacterium]MDW8418587.1 T9SS type A sorting domain-containing protein [Chitinophagales bacterium]